MPLPAPRDVRSLAKAFLNYRLEVGLDSVLDQFDWGGVLPIQVYSAALNRLPESAEAAMPWGPDYDPRLHFALVLESEEFQQRIRSILLAAFPEKRRLIFVHVAKCAGTDLSAQLCRRFAHFSDSYADQRWMGRLELFGHIRDFVVRLENAPAIFVFGHINLPEVLESGAYRYGDELFTVIRDPVDRTLSAVNYVLKVLCDPEGVHRPDRLEWLEALGWSEAPSQLSGGALRDLAHQVLRHPGIIAPNALCGALGWGDSASAIDAIVRSNIEITDTKRYQAWLGARWGEPSSERLNASARVLTAADLSIEDIAYIEDINAEDRVLYEMIKTRLDIRHEASITGLCLDL